MNSFCPRHWSLKQRLEHRSIRDPKTGCILWTGSRTTNGYGGLNFNGRHWQAHRASWTAIHGPIPTAFWSAIAAMCGPASIPSIFFSARKKKTWPTRSPSRDMSGARRRDRNGAEQGAGDHAHRDAGPRVRHPRAGLRPLRRPKPSAREHLVQQVDHRAPRALVGSCVVAVAGRR